MNNREMLLIESCCGPIEIDLNESSSTNKNPRFRGKFQEANAVNKNKRMYPFEVLAKNVDALEETIKARGLYGELDHASDSIVHLGNVSHLITKLYWEGNNLMGEAEILPTASGMILRKLIECGCRVGMSSRAVGTGETNNEGVLVIGPSLRIVTFDLVAEPSTNMAFQKIIDGKNESFQPILTHSKKTNHRTLVSYFGTNLDLKVEEMRKRIRNK